MLRRSKSELRKALIAKRQSLESIQAAAWSKIIVKHCLESADWSKVKSLHSYVPIKAQNEVDTWPLLKMVWQRWPHIITAVSRIKDQSLEAVTVDSNTKWRKGSFGIAEPQNGQPLADNYQFDVVLIPMLGFDSTGYRLGYGKGFYDRFLAAQLQAQTMGLCYQFGCLPNLMPHEPHDIPLKKVITEQHVYRFRRQIS